MEATAPFTLRWRRWFEAWLDRRPSRVYNEEDTIRMGGEQGPGKLGTERKGEAKPNGPRVDPKVQQGIGKTAVKGAQKK